jgi:osmotically-inducible protein OsmY
LEDISDRICDNPYLDASEVEVEVTNGEVILKGEVNDRESKRLAEDIGESVPGVRNVENRLRITKTGI